MLLTIFSASVLKGVDLELTNYKSGISLEWIGEKGVDYQEEYLYFDKVVSDRKIVYIKDSTKISMFHNERNRAGTAGGSDSYESVGTDIGKIRYKVDGDQRWQIYPNNYTRYENPISFSELNYGLYGDSDIPVVGSTGSNGKPLDLENKSSRYFKGIEDSTGDEWHTITVLDDDSDYAGSIEYQSSDAKIFYFIVNPKTPALTIRAQNGGQFYTTPPKKYFVPIIYDNITYIRGEVSLELNDINGNNIRYRINGGEFIEVGAPTANLDQNDFNSGDNILEYYYEGNEAFVRTRKVVKNPGFPSADEKHGNRLWLSQKYWDNDIKGRLWGDRKWWLDEWRASNTWSNRHYLESSARKGIRAVFTNAALPNAICAKVFGAGYKHSKLKRSYADYAKLALFEIPTMMDPVGAELNTSNSSIPSRELIYRGYYDINPIVESAATYDILISMFRTDLGFKKGISPIEDFFIRDSLARWVHLTTMVDFGGYGDPMWDEFNSGGMWDTARKVGGAMVASMMPNYSTEYFGTSGMNGEEARFLNTPFPDVSYTWKQLFFDNNVEMTGFPNIHKRLGIEEYLLNEEGNYLDRRGYMGTIQMGHVFGIYYNLVKLFSPSKELPNLEAMKARAPIGQLYGLKAINEADTRPATQVFVCWQNAWHKDFKAIAQPITLAVSNSGSDNHIGKQFARGGPLYVLWYDHNIPVPMPPSGAPGPELLINNEQSGDPPEG